MIVDCIEPKLSDVVVTYYDGDYDESVPNNTSYQGHGVVNLDNGCIYDGNLKNGMFQGIGIFKWPNGVKFEGTFEYGNINGKGAYEWHDGSSFNGSVVNGLRHGTGKFLSSTGQTYDGEWKDGKRYGNGKLWYNEDRTLTYTGEWQNNMRHGYGVMKYSSGSVYEGEWEYDKKCGSGVMVWKNVDESYCGEWKNDLPNGLGEYIWGDNGSKSMKKECCNIYRGNFVDGKRQGKGTFFYMNGSQYTGEWYEDEKHGDGVFIYPDGRMFCGLFQNNRIVTSKEEFPRATEAVNPQYCLQNISDIYDYYPNLLTTTVTGIKDTLNSDIKDMERLLLKYNQYIRSALRRYTDFSNIKRSKDAQAQTQSLQNFSPISRADKVHKACVTVRAFHKRVFCMSFEQMLRFLRECGIVDTVFRSYDLGLCLRKMRRAATENSLDQLQEYKSALIEQQIIGDDKEILEAVMDEDLALKAIHFGDEVDQRDTAIPEYFSLCYLMDGFLHPQSTDCFFDIHVSQPLFDREVVELFVRAIAEWYIRVKNNKIDSSSLSTIKDLGADMSLKQVLYYVLAKKLLPLTSSFEENIPPFYSLYYNDDIQSLLKAGPYRENSNSEDEPSSAHFMKLWKYLCSNVAGIDFADSDDNHSTVAGQSLNTLHVPDSFEKKIHSGGYTEIRHLVNLFISMKGSVISSDVTIRELLSFMNLLSINPTTSLPDTIQIIHAVDNSNNSSSSEEKDAVSQSSGNEFENIEKKKDVDITSKSDVVDIADYLYLSLKIDFEDYLEIMCRVISSKSWIYEAPVLVVTSNSEIMPLDEDNNTSSDSKIESNTTECVGISEEIVVNENTNQKSVEEILYDRICIWTQYFDIDTFIHSVSTK